jgi:predicted DNA-binding transcriptional regulator YafY
MERELLYRVFDLDSMLRAHSHPISLNKILSELRCSLSTFKNTKKILNNLGYPIAYCRKRNGYYYDRDSKVQVLGLWFNTNELQTLLIIQQLLSQLQPSLFHSQFQALAQQADRLLTFVGKSPQNIAKRLRVIPIAYQQIPPEIFLPLSKAVLHSQVLHIQYQDISGKVSERILSPQRLVYYRDHWYLDAWCHLRNSLRTFWVAGIRSIHPTDEQFKHVEESLLDQEVEESYGIFTGEVVNTAHLHFIGQSAMRVRGAQWHSQQRQQVNDDGSVELWVPYSDHRELVMDVLRYGAEVTVLAPTSLQAEVVARLRATLKKYEKSLAKARDVS